MNRRGFLKGVVAACYLPEVVPEATAVEAVTFTAAKVSAGPIMAMAPIKVVAPRDMLPGFIQYRVRGDARVYEVEVQCPIPAIGGADTAELCRLSPDVCEVRVITAWRSSITMDIGTTKEDPDDGRRPT